MVILKVLEKKKVGISAINLTKTSFDKKALQDLKENKYSFVYLVSQFVRVWQKTV